METIEPRQNIVKAVMFSLAAVVMVMLPVYFLWMLFGSAMYQEFPNGKPPVQLIVGLLTLVTIAWPLAFAGVMIHRAARSLMPLPERFRDAAFVTLFVVLPIAMTAVGWIFRDNGLLIVLLFWMPMIAVSYMSGDADRMMNKFVAFLKTLGPARAEQ